MKKVIAAAASFGAYLSFALPVFAQSSTTLSLCPKEPPFNVLCGLTGDKAPNIISVAITLMFIAAVVIALIFLIWGGIKWILSGGDKTAVEAARNHIIAAIIGLIVTFASFFILNIVAQIFKVDLLNIKLPQF